MTSWVGIRLRMLAYQIVHRCRMGHVRVSTINIRIDPPGSIRDAEKSLESSARFANEK
jgi:hypothetical protein